ncbi:hypothetical protein [Spirulina sp. 06S082]|uniref:DUF6414 family protein n=1 Tax=Spirulina sp. 06S082 TaxID=3110248 RepID=UPI002B1EE59C|nr:hypothetical protein [Spirulina sp. 06S082]MEA5471971.1 hypothetical protein [Spirulina sp. 06S082]
MKQTEMETEAKIRNLIYLDEKKMYSLSSQIFQGITEYIINENKQVKQNNESQKGPIASGKVLADVLTISGRDTEKKYLHDYSYSVFEKHLVDLGKVAQYNEEVISETNKNLLEEQSFIRVSAKATFYDIERITHLFKNFNAIGEAIVYATNYEKIKTINSQTRKSQSKNKGFSLENQNQENKKLTNTIREIAEKEGLYQDPEFLKKILVLINYGFKDQLELHQKINDLVFYSVLQREYLREPEEILIKKYSRKTEKQLVVFGLITQISERTNPDIIPTLPADASIKEALMLIIEQLANIEQQFSKKLPNEIVIDPIAIYTEL